MANESNKVIVANGALYWLISKVFLGDSFLYGKSIDMKGEQFWLINNGSLLKYTFLLAFPADKALNPASSFEIEDLVMAEAINISVLISFLVPSLSAQLANEFAAILDLEKFLKHG